DKVLRERLVRIGRERLALFDVKLAARKLFDAFRSLMRQEYDFPRKPGYAYEPPLLVAPTPASSADWKIEIVYEGAGSRKCTVYLDEVPFASFTPLTKEGGKFSFVCRPEGRT